MPLADSFWSDEQKRLLAIVRPRLAQMAYDGAKQAARKLGLTFNPTLANAQAVAYAREQTDKLLGELWQTNEKLVGETLAGWLDTPGATVGDLQRSLIERGFGTARASVIAATETTRAYASGEMAAYQAEGYTEWTWVAHRDELRCPICGKLAGKTVRMGAPFGVFRGEEVKQPPAHPNCRCTVKVVVKARDFSSLAKPQPAPQAAPAPVKPVKRGADVRQEVEAAQKNKAKLESILWERENTTNLYREINTARLDRARELENLEQDKKQDPEYEWLASELDRVGKEIDEMTAEYRKAYEANNWDAKAALRVETPGTITAQYSKSKYTDDWKQGVSEFQSLVDAQFTNAKSVSLTSTIKNRSFFDIYNNTVTLSAGAPTRTTVHELGHWLEKENTYIHQKALDFLARRTAGEALEPLKNFGKGYDAHEMTRKDKFINPYMGKDYSVYGAGNYATEVISMGVEYMWADPAAFAKADPDYFDFIVDVLRGLA